MFSKLAPWIFAALSGLSMGLAWMYTGQAACAALGWAATLLLLLAIEPFGRSYLPSYLAGIIQTSIGFHWLFGTIKEFGGFDSIAAGFIFAFFVLVSALQNIVFLFVHRNLSPRFHRLALAAPLAWVISETISIRIFPWHFGQTQLALSELAQVADLGGSRLISFLMFWVSASFLRLVWCKDFRLHLGAAFAALIAAFLYGKFAIYNVNNSLGPAVKVALVQANISIQEKNNIKFFEQNAERYEAITSQIAEDGMIVVWPETVLQDWIYSGTTSVFADPRLPKFEKKFHLITGALTFSSQEIFHNSALVILSDGTIAPPYHKQILMPFGEYMPLSSIFPSLKSLNPAMGDFEAGKDVAAIEIPLDSGQAYNARVAPLICYEDVVSDLSRRSVQKGANLLVNLTNDAWFGNSAAPYQHNLIASFRSIENRRYLLRATNSGLTAIVNPLGETVFSIPPFSEGSIIASVNLMRYNTVYTRFLGDNLWWLLAAWVALLLSCNMCLRRVK